MFLLSAITYCRRRTAIALTVTALLSACASAPVDQIELIVQFLKLRGVKSPENPVAGFRQGRGDDVPGHQRPLGQILQGGIMHHRDDGK